MILKSSTDIPFQVLQVVHLWYVSVNEGVETVTKEFLLAFSLNKIKSQTFFLNFGLDEKLDLYEIRLLSHFLQSDFGRKGCLQTIKVPQAPTGISLCAEVMADLETFPHFRPSKKLRRRKRADE